jgi:hypothetical protein
MEKFKLNVSGWIEIDQTVVVEAEDSEKAIDEALELFDVNGQVDVFGLTFDVIKPDGLLNS